MKNIILIGAGGHCRSCIDVIEQENKYKIKGLIDIEEKIGQDVLGYRIIDCDKNLEKYVNDNSFLITLGQIKSADKRIEIFEKLKKLDAKIATSISPLAYVSKYAKIDEGSIIMHNAIINANAFVGKNCIINSKALIEHDAIVQDNCHISTGAIINGGSIVEKNSFVGSGAVVVQGITVKENSFIKAGSVTK